MRSFERNLSPCTFAYAISTPFRQIVPIKATLDNHKCIRSDRMALPCVGQQGAIVWRRRDSSNIS